MHKLQFKYAFAPEHRKTVEQANRPDDGLVANPRAPIERPQDRYAIADKRLFQYADQHTPITVTLLEGERFACTINWFGRFELSVSLINEHADVQIFRHALHRIQVA